MKAIVISEFGGPEVLKIEERPQPNISENEVLIKVKAFGINRPDIFQRKGKYPAPEGIVQDIPGLEVAGEIVSIGNNVKDFREGQRVCALVAGGGYAEFVNVHSGHCIEIPDWLSFEEAAVFPETLFTVFSNVFERGKLQSGQRLLVHGGGSGIGVMAIQLAKSIGANVVVTVGSDEKGEKCLALGAEEYINYKENNFEEVLKNKKVDVILDMIGGDYFPKNINCLNEDGHLVYINAMQDRMASLDILKVMVKRLTITGSTLRARDIHFKESLRNKIVSQIWQFIEDKSVRSVISHTFDWKDIQKAHQVMESNQHFGKIVAVVSV